MSDASNYLETAIGDHVLLNAAYTSPTTIYLALFTAVSDAEAGTGTEVSTSGTAYAREAISFGAGSNGVYANDAAVEFAEATASWGTVTHFAITDHVSAGNKLTAIKALAASKAVDTGDTLSFPIGDLTVTIA
jgi:hypothetical protein